MSIINKKNHIILFQEKHLIITLKTTIPEGDKINSKTKKGSICSDSSNNIYYRRNYRSFIHNLLLFDSSNNWSEHFFLGSNHPLH